MANRNSAGRTSVHVQKELDSRPEEYTTAYLRRLIAERGHIRAALYNHGGSIITHGSSLDLEGQDQYSSQIGNDFHADLIEAESIISGEMTKEQQDILLAWADGTDENTAAALVRVKPGGALRMRRMRAVEKLTDRMQSDDQRTGERSRGFNKSMGQGEGQDNAGVGDSRFAEIASREETRSPYDRSKE